MSRPSKYHPEICNKVNEYLEQCKDQEVFYCKSRGLYSNSYTRHLDIKLPSIRDFADYLGIAESTIYEWKKRYNEFSESLDKILQEQIVRLINKGLSGEYRASIVKLILCANHGFCNKSKRR